MKKLAFLLLVLIIAGGLNFTVSAQNNSSGITLSCFDIDITPPVGSYLAYNSSVNKWDQGLRARGIVIKGAGQPIVLSSFDWIGIAGEGQDEFRKALAEAAGTVPERVEVHTVHQHDAPACDFGAEKILREAGLKPMRYEGTFARDVIVRLKEAVRKSLETAVPVTHLGTGKAEVFKVASNRRILGPDGKVRATRYTTCKDPALRAEPEGIIDPYVTLISFWNGDKPIAVLSYYATHPQSYYGTGVPNPDFPGIARFMRQLAMPDALHIHFNGAGGNIAAGKYNDGSHENRGILAMRLADGMKRAWEATKREPLNPGQVKWSVEPVILPPAEHVLNTQKIMKEKPGDTTFIRKNIESLSWYKRCQAGKKINITCLALGSARILHMPGELCVEYQLAAKAKRPDLFVTMAAYGDYAPGYICTAKGYEEGGYEGGEASLVSPKVEGVLMTAIDRLLK